MTIEPPFPGPLYKRCEDDGCPSAYAYRAPFKVVLHWHYIGNNLGARYAERVTRPRVLTEEDQDTVWSLLATERLVADEPWTNKHGNVIDYGPQFGEDDDG